LSDVEKRIEGIAKQLNKVTAQLNERKLQADKAIKTGQSVYGQSQSGWQSVKGVFGGTSGTFLLLLGLIGAGIFLYHEMYVPTVPWNTYLTNGVKQFFYTLRDSVSSSMGAATSDFSGWFARNWPTIALYVGWIYAIIRISSLAKAGLVKASSSINANKPTNIRKELAITKDRLAHTGKSLEDNITSNKELKQINENLEHTLSETSKELEDLRAFQDKIKADPLYQQVMAKAKP
jgi:hypothetical protein